MKRIAIFALSILVLTQAYTFSQAEALSVSTNSDSYQQGDVIEISGVVSVSSDPSKAFDVTIKVTAPNGNLVTIQQATPSSDGSYFLSIASGVSWKFEGDYTVTAYFDPKSVSTSFTLSAPSAIDAAAEAAKAAADAAAKAAADAAAKAAADAAAKAAADAAAKAAAAVEVVTEGLACRSGTYEADGFCIPDGSGSFELSYDSASVNGLILTAAITFGIAVAIIIALRLIGKAGRSR